MYSLGQIVAFIIGACGLILTILNILDKQRTFKMRADEPFKELKIRVDGHDVEINDIKSALRRAMTDLENRKTQMRCLYIPHWP